MGHRCRAVTAAEYINGILSHTPVRGKLTTNDSHKARGILQHRVGAREFGGGMLRAAGAQERPVAGIHTDNIVGRKIDREIAVQVMQEIVDVLLRGGWM